MGQGDARDAGRAEPAPCALPSHFVGDEILAEQSSDPRGQGTFLSIQVQTSTKGSQDEGTEGRRCCGKGRQEPCLYPSRAELLQAEHSSFTSICWRLWHGDGGWLRDDPWGSVTPLQPSLHPTPQRGAGFAKGHQLIPWDTTGDTSLVAQGILGEQS